METIRIVKKGEKAIAQFPIWKYTLKRILDDNKQVMLDDKGNECTESNMFLKVSSFFKMSQVEKIKEGK